MLVQYHGDPNAGGEGPETVEAWGKTFVKGGDYVEFPDDFQHKDTMIGNHHFHVKGVGDTSKTDPLDDERVNPAHVDQDEAREVEDIKAELDRRGVQYHHRSGLKTLRKQLQDAAPTDATT